MKSRRWVSVVTLIVATLTAQSAVTYATTSTIVADQSFCGFECGVLGRTTTSTIVADQSEQIPNEVLAAESYVEVPVICNGEEADNVVTFLEKLCNKGNSNEVYVGGYVAINVKAYAYKTGSNIKVGAVITYMNKNGEVVSDWWDNVEQFYSIEEANTYGLWTDNATYTLNLLDNISFTMPDQNENDLRITLELVGMKSTFSRPTNQNVDLLEEVSEGEEDKVPEVEEDKVPEVEEDKVPEVEEDKVPEVEEDKVPEVEEDEVPEVEEDKVPEVEEDKVPEVEEDKVPEVEEDKVPEVEEDKVPEVEEDKAPSDNNYDSASGLDPEYY